MGDSGISVTNGMEHGVALAMVEFKHGLEHEVLNTAIEALAFARENAPWQDITGHARDGLDTDVEWVGEAIVWSLFHTVDYGIYLETRWNGAFAIIMPTLEQFAPEVGSGIHGE